MPQYAVLDWGIDIPRNLTLLTSVTLPLQRLKCSVATDNSHLWYMDYSTTQKTKTIILLGHKRIIDCPVTIGFVD